MADVDALLYLPGHDAGAAEGGPGHPGPEPGLARVVPEHAGEPRGRLSPAGVAVAPPPAWAGFRTLTVTDVVAESASVTSFRFAADDALPAYRPGQFLTLRVPGAGDPVPVRTYSLSGDPDGGRYRISVKRESHGLVSSYLHAHLHRGDRIEVAAPRGDFVLDEGTEPVLLISAGIGLTPRAGDAAPARERGAARARCGGSTPPTTRTATPSPPRSPTCSADCRQRTPSSTTRLRRSRSPPDSGVRAGRLTAEVVAGLGLPADANAYVCGPEPFMDDVAAALAGVGIDPARIHTERFGSRSPINPGVVGADAPPPHQPPGPPGAGPAVTFARSGLTTAWSDTYSSVLELAEACDVPTQWSCRTGVCHTCVTAVLSGEASYETPPLEAPGDDELLICSARPTADLVLDL